MFYFDGSKKILSQIEDILFDDDKYKQRAAAEVLAGVITGTDTVLHLIAALLRRSSGSRHWPQPEVDALWGWVMERIDRIFAQIKPDTASFWDTIFVVWIYVSINVTPSSDDLKDADR
jgi:proteasome activator subunit 4